MVHTYIMFIQLIFGLCWIGINADEGWFWHVTDFHYDFSYLGRDLSCIENVTKHGKFGDYWCDAPWTLINSSVEYMKSTKPDVDFILWTGDNTLHASNDDLSTDIVDGLIGNVTDVIYNLFPTTSVYPTFGNHDYFPKNMFPPHGNGLYNRTFDRWRHWIGGLPTQEASFKKGGYYTAVTKHGLRVVGLNTNMYLTHDTRSEHIEDPADQFMWLENVLNSARSTKEKVLITGHASPGIGIPGAQPWIFQRFNDKMNEVFTRFSDVIVGTHFGHEHWDNFRVHYSAGTPVISQFCAPSVTPWRYTGVSAHNPAVRLVNYNRQTGRHLNVIQYIMDLPKSNEQKRPAWRLEYNATRDYQIDDVTPTSLHNLIQRMKAKGSVEFFNFFKWRYSSVGDTLVTPCNDLCVTYLKCSLDNIDQTSFDDCVKTIVGSAGFLNPTALHITFILIIYFLDLMM